MKFYDFAIELAVAAGALLLDKKQQAFSVGSKHGNPRDIVTSLDIEIGNFLTEQIVAEYPEHGIYNEEADTVDGNEYLWVLDPIDGTASFARGIPQYAISIGLMKDGVPLVGVVFDPMANELFSFAQGRGAFLNGEPLRVSTGADLKDAFVLLAPGRKPEQFEWAGESLKKLLANTNKVKNYGSSALSLCYIAAGRIEGLVMGTLTGIDAAPAIGILREAGGEVLDNTGQSLAITGDKRRIYAGNSAVMAERLRLLLE